MDGKTGSLREQWERRMEEAWQRMFGEKSQEELVTFAQREDMAVLIAKELAAFMLEQHVASDSAVQPAEASTTCCPKCGQPGKPAVRKGEALVKRAVRTRVGNVRLRRQRWYCGKCRSVFFPLDVRLKLGTEGQKGVRTILPLRGRKCGRNGGKPSFLGSVVSSRRLVIGQCRRVSLRRRAKC